MLPVRDACSLFMEKHMDWSNCLGIHCFAETMNCEQLKLIAKDFALRSVRVERSREQVNRGVRMYSQLLGKFMLDGTFEPFPCLAACV